MTASGSAATTARSSASASKTSQTTAAAPAAADLLRPLLAPRHPRHLVPGRDQLAHQRPADRAAGPRDEDPHR